MQPIRIDQALPSLGRFDAIGIDARNTRDLLRSMGFESDIFSDRYEAKTGGVPMRKYVFDPSKILIYHFSIGSSIPYLLMSHGNFYINRYHNVTPARFFSYPGAYQAKAACQQGRKQLPVVSEICSYHLPVSGYNESELPDVEGQSSVLPLLRDYKRLSEISPCAKTMEVFSGGKKIILFVGRLVPSKAQHDLLFFLHEYQKKYSSDIRLVFVGGYDRFYALGLFSKLCEDFGLSLSFGSSGLKKTDVTVTGQIPDQELCALYRSASLFCCVSEHEGFCVPLVEAMSFGLPILSHRSSAIPETVGDGGIIEDKKNADQFLEKIYTLTNSANDRKLASQKALKRSQDFSWDRLNQTFSSAIDQALKLYDRSSSYH